MLQTILFFTLRNHAKNLGTSTTKSAENENSELWLVVSIINSLINIVIQIYKVKTEAKEEVIVSFYIHW